MAPESSTRSTRTTEKSALGISNNNKATSKSQPPPKKRRYIPGGPGGGGRYVDEDGTEIPVGGTGPGGYNYIGPRGRIGRENAANGVQPVTYPRNRNPRTTAQPATAAATTATRPSISRQPQKTMSRRFDSAAQAAAAVQSDGYKPREERSWEEFHPDLDINSDFLALDANEVDGIKPPSRPVTPPASTSASNETNGSHTPNGMTKGDSSVTPSGSLNGDALSFSIPGTPGGMKRGPGRPPKDPVAFYARKQASNTGAGAQQAPQAMAILNTTAKEKLSLNKPEFRPSEALKKYESKTRYVDKSMANVGYQESDEFIRPDTYIKGSDMSFDDDLGEGSNSVGRVEYDMDLLDMMWLEILNQNRKEIGLEAVTEEIFEITMTKIEKEWYALEKRIPKPNPKAPQTHRPRSSSAAAVNGEPQAGEEQDSKCAICDDGDCENTNAIVFCDGCDLAVHQECYGVPFIPEGQWLCRKCQLIGRGVPTCIFCPNTEGAFKQSSNRWAHLLCAMWIPEVNLGNYAFMEPVMDVEKVPKSRWKLLCYICSQPMGACIQCGNRACYKAFHVTCARRCRLYLKMKNAHGQLSIIDNTPLKAFCHDHCPPDYAKENDVARGYAEARAWYKKNMRGRIWAENQESALAIAATHQHAVTEHEPNESQLTGAQIANSTVDGRKTGNQPAKPTGKLPSGAPVIPHIIYSTVESSLQRFNILRRKEFVADVCAYWTLKREQRRGAPLIKRLQLQNDTFSSHEVTRRNYPAMGPIGRERLDRRIEFGSLVVQDLQKLVVLTSGVAEREKQKMEKAQNEKDIIENIYFPLIPYITAILDKAFQLDTKKVFTHAFNELKSRVHDYYYVSAILFANDLAIAFTTGIRTELPKSSAVPTIEAETSSPSRKSIPDIRERRNIAKRIIRAVLPKLEEVIRAEALVAERSIEVELDRLRNLLDSCTDIASKLTGEGAAEDNQPRGSEQAKEPSVNGQSQSGNGSVDMEDAPGEDEDSIHVMSTNVVDQLSVSGNSDVNVNGYMPQEDNGINLSRANGQTTMDDIETSSSAPGDAARETLSNGGVPRFLIESFHVDGTHITPLNGKAAEAAVSEDLSDLEDADGEVDESGIEKPTASAPSAAKHKKGKKKRVRGKK